MPTSSTAGTRVIGRLLRVLASTVASALLVVGVPWLLATTIGNPLDRLPDLLAGDVNDQVILAAIAAVVWLAWAQFAIAFVVELASALRRTPMPRRIPGVFGFQQGLARALVNGALLLLPLTLSTVAPAAQALAMAPAAAPPPAPAAAPATVAPAPRPQVPTQPVSVSADGARTWWDLAVQHLGDGSRWHQLWELNQGRAQDDGTVLRNDRTVLKLGWTVLVPATEPAARSAAQAAADVAVDVTVQPGDTLSELAAEHASGDWPQLWQANAGRAEPGGAHLTDPDYIEPGWTITIPAPLATDSGTDSAGAATDSGSNGMAADRVVVEPGDTLSGIAAARGADLDAVIAANTGVPQPDGQALTDPDDIEPGWTITIPRPADAQPSAGTDSGPSAAPTPPEPAQPPAATEPGASDSTPPAATEPGPADSTPLAATGPGTANSVPSAAATGPASPSAAPASAPSVPTAPVLTPAVSSPAAGSPSSDSSSSNSSSSSSVATSFAVFAGGGGVLAALLLAALVRARRRQLQHRRPGELVAAAPSGLLEIERALRSVGGASSADAQWLDEALRGLGHAVAASDGALSLPDVLAVCATDTRLRLVLASPCPTPVGAWTPQSDGTWVLDRGQSTGYDPQRRDRDVTPYPTLATVGYTAGGEHWLLDLERIGALTLTGDAERATNLARFLAAELAHNSWAELLQVTLVGFGAEMAQMHPDRLTYAADPAAALDAVTAQLRSVAAVVDESGLPVLDGRGRGIAGDAWAPHVLLIAPQALPDDATDRAGLTELLDAVTGRGDRSTVALVVTTGGNTDDTDVAAAGDGGWVLRVDEHGVLSIPDLGLELIAQQIPPEQAGQLAQLLALAVNTDEGSVASPLPEDKPVSTHPRPEPDEARWARADSALPLPEQVYLEQSATTSRDLQAMAPVVQADVREQLAAGDPDLDADVAEWTDRASSRPRIAVLGAVAVWPRGGASPRPLSPMKAEIAVYLSMHPTGVSPEQYGTDLWPEDPGIAGSTKLRNSIYELRRALGVNARTGTEYLPRNAATNGALYRLEDVLIDAELFRRLRLRGFTRDEQDDRLADWWQALHLVRGAPFDNQRPGGYGWLAGRPVDHEYTATMVDLAHAVATHHLAVGEPDRAEAAAKIALTATRGVEGASDISLLDLVWACDAQDRRAEGDAHVKQILRNHGADDLEDLSPRTYDVLRRRQLLPPAA
ncbi:LysM peptidoglycan-binding domain-containing protein [Nakamurella endophytica]|uniref:LysM domain-containing protein n=1 Tax=Nakamurella endophytica TaxID=1748367 RepID=A0A917T4K9_9ACTN|nr:LysM domain-containing protein [Nakamurella endophytica]GGM10021.1 hypothetical protein GCM10011594_32440 [Nakamurella endophytica]